MSYEGYEVWLCANGHRHFFDCYDAPEAKSWRCHCGAAVAWEYAVDQTNGPGDEPDLTIAKAAVFKSCACCGNRSQVEEATYVIPKETP